MKINAFGRSLQDDNLNNRISNRLKFFGTNTTLFKKGVIKNSQLLLLLFYYFTLLYRLAVNMAPEIFNERYGLIFLQKL